MYQNAGWNTSNFSAPDTEFDSTTFNPPIPGPVETLPIITGSSTNTVLSGNYTIQVQFQVIQNGGTPVVGQTSFTTNITASLLLRTVKLSASYDCVSSPTTFTATDNTQLGTTLYSYVSVTRSITVTPPTVTGQLPTTASGNTVTIQNIWSPAPYQYNVVGIANYTLGNDTFAVNYTGYDATEVICNSLFCKFRCWLGIITNWFNLEKNTTTKNQYQQQMVLGQYFFNMAVWSQGCGDTIAYDRYIKEFICITKFDPDCSCCDNLQPMPVIPAGQVGPPGANGLTPEFQTAGNWVQWKYTTGGGGWTNLYQIPQGTPGQSGSNGAAVLYNDLTVTSNTVASIQSLKDYPLPAGTVTTNGSEIRIRSVVFAAAPTTSVQVELQIGAVSLYTNTFTPPPATTVDAYFYDITISKTGTGTASVTGFVHEIDNYGLGFQKNTISYPIFPTNIVVDWTIVQTIFVNVTSNATSGTSCSQLEVIVYQFGIVAPNITIQGTYANQAAAAAGNVQPGEYFITTATEALTLKT